MSATLQVTHKAIGVEVRRDPYDVVVDGELVAFRCTGKRFVLVFLASFIVPRLKLTLVRE